MIIFVEVVFPQYTIEARRMIINMAQAYRDRGEEMEIEDGFELYRELSEIRRIFSEAHPTTQFPVSLEEFLVEFPWRWVQTIDSKVIGWVDAAVQHDDIMAKVPEGEILGDERHTSSAVDIFRSFNQPIDYLKKLEWQDDFQYAKLMTAMAKILGKGISRYCEVLEKLFTFEMDRSTPEQEAARSQTTQQKWMAIAKDAWSNKEKVQPFQFAPEVICCHL
jgi:SOS response regulatory protein OraA/RecX